MEWFNKSAESGLAAAQMELAELLRSTEEVKDVELACKWFSKAANLGKTNAHIKLGMIYYRGEGVEKDIQEAYQHFRRAADDGDSKAQYLVGWMKAGNGLPPDRREAVRWLRKAAKQGHDDAGRLLTQIQKKE